MFTPWGPRCLLLCQLRCLGSHLILLLLIIKVGLPKDSWMTLKLIREVGPLMNFQLVLLSTLPFSPNLHRPLRGNLKTQCLSVGLSTVRRCLISFLSNAVALGHTWQVCLESFSVNSHRWPVVPHWAQSSSSLFPYTQHSQ